MNAYDIARRERTKQIAEANGVTFTVSDNIKFYDKNKLCLGIQKTVDEAYAFMCGYDSRSKNRVGAKTN
jgi:glutathionylspermidine synthase